MKASPPLLVTCVAMALTACGANTPRARPTADTAKIVDAIKTDEVHWNSDYKKGDAAVLADPLCGRRVPDGAGSRAGRRYGGDQGGGWKRRCPTRPSL